MGFPIRAKFPDGSVYYLIHSVERIEEWKRLGQRYLYHDFRVKDYSDALYIKDLLDLMKKGDIEMCSETELLAIQVLGV